MGKIAANRGIASPATIQNEYWNYVIPNSVRVPSPIASPDKVFGSVTLRSDLNTIVIAK